ncbi:MAG TPA: CAP domain-containing protein [Polyangiaceae bacterium]|nr:CAP domain-containing protein [Polyangiaceae bacterium]
MFHRTLRGWLVLGFALTLSVGCSKQLTARFVPEPIPVPDAVSLYMSEARPEGAVGGRGIEQLEADVVAALAKRGDHAQPDGALSAAASWALSEANQGRSVDAIATEAAARRFGFGGIVIATVVVGMDQQDLWRQQLERTPSNMPITRYGIRVSPSGHSASLLFGSAELSFEAIPRSLEPGQSVALKGEVAPRFKFSHVYLTKPDGTVEEKRMTGRAIDASFALEAAGRYQLEVMGDGVSGPVVVSNLPLYVGIPEPTETAAAGAVVDPEQAEARLLVLVNEARAAAGLGKVLPDAELRDVAMGHTSDMVDHHFFSHVSSKTGTPTDRMRRSGALVAGSGENIAMAATPEVAHEGLMNSPGHRANILNRSWTHVGIAVKNGEGGLVVTQMFGRRPDPAALPTSVAQVEAAVASLRASKGLPAVSVDPIYRAAAQAGADAYAKGGDEDDIAKATQSGLEREATRLQSARSASCSQRLELLELSSLNEILTLSEPALRRYGVGARMHRDGKGSRLSTMFIFEGVQCK